MSDVQREDVTRRFVVEVTLRPHAPDDFNTRMAFVDWLFEMNEMHGGPTWLRSIDDIDLLPIEQFGRQLQEGGER